MAIVFGGSIVILCLLLCYQSNGNVIPVDANNLKKILAADLAFLNFYADWCHFSNQLDPIFLEAAKIFPKPDLEKKNSVVFGKVDCVRNEDICQNNRINKYPTMKLFRRGAIAKNEYRGSRSKDAIAAFINSQLTDPFKVFTSRDELLTGINKEKGNVIAYAEDLESKGLDNFKIAAFQLRDECEFSIARGASFSSDTSSGTKVVFREKGASGDEAVFNGDLTDLRYVFNWIRDKCIPLIRELTFENAEALTEEGLPFLVLFKDKNDKESLETFTQAVIRELSDERGKLTMLYADGEKFSHPLMHLGKSKKDLPVVAIDSFQHMYLFPNINHLRAKGKLKQFVLDLHSEKLHREFHHGPDSTQKPMETGDSSSSETTKRPSIFKSLKPSPHRYTLLDKTEL